MNSSRMKRGIATAAVVMLSAAAMTSCSSDDDGSPVAEGGSGTGTVKIWAHQGQELEVAALQKAVTDFNAAGKGVTAELRLVPEADYSRTLAATKPEDLPDVLEFDGPTLSNLVFNGKLSPIDEYAATAKSNATPAILAQGTAADGKLYGLGMFDSGLGLWGNKRLLDAANVKYPTAAADAWTPEQVDAALKALAGKDADRKVLDINENSGLGGEWGTYGFSPVIQSAGANLIKDGKAMGALDSDAAAAALKTVASWKSFVDPNTDTQAFAKGRVALSWVGHWMYPAYSKALKSDLVLLPLPNFGQGTKTGQGSWAWGIGSKSANASAAGKFIDYLMSDGPVTAMTTANGAPPGTKSAVAASKLYKEGGPLRLYADQLSATCGTGELTVQCVSVPRPVTAGYPIITQAFARALAAVYGGADPKTELGKAARTIDDDFSQNDGYRLDG